MNIDIHVEDGGGLNIDTLQHTIWSSSVSWEKKYFKKSEMDKELQIFPYNKKQINKNKKHPDLMLFS